MTLSYIGLSSPPSSWLRSVQPIPVHSCISLVLTKTLQGQLISSAIGPIAKKKGFGFELKNSTKSETEISVFWLRLPVILFAVVEHENSKIGKQCKYA
jgi:hypothetical protein